MPLPTFLFGSLAIGIGAALAAGEELRLSPRALFLTRSFAALALYEALVVLPAAIYFYVFHGDWFLLYFADMKRIPSAAALVGFVLLGTVAAAGFGFGAAMVRGQRLSVGLVAVGASLLCLVGSLALFSGRLSVVGTFAQYRGGFGLAVYSTGPVLRGAVAMGAILVAGATFLLLRLRYRPRPT